MGNLALDANVVIGLLDPADAHHMRSVSELNRRAEPRPFLVMAASAYSEVLVGALRSGRGEVVERFVDRSKTEIVPIDREIARSAASLRSRHRSLRLGDALVLASAFARQAELLTFDDRLRRIAREAGP